MSTDLSIIEQIKTGGLEKERAIRLLLQQHWGLIKRAQGRYRLSADEAEEVFLDSLMAFAAAVLKGTFRGESKISTYLFRVMENRSKNKIRDLSRAEAKYPFVQEMPAMPEKANNILQEMIQREDQNWVELFLQQAGEKCRKILTMQVFGGYNLEEISQTLGFKSARSVSTTRHRCIEKLKTILNGAGGTSSGLKGE